MALLSSPLQYVTSTPPTTRAFTTLTLAFSLLYYWIQWRPITSPWSSAWQYVLVVPGSSIFYPWTFVTAGLVESSLIELFFTLLIVPASLRYLERLWGSVETAKFIVVSLALPNLISVLINWGEFILTKNADLFLYGMHYSGQMALQTAILVAFTQLIPEHQVHIFGVIKARVKRLPMAYVGFSNVMCVLGWQSPYILIQFGWLVSWIYLRFYKRNTGDIGNDAYGDRSETFAFVHWFPPFVHYPVSLLSNVVYRGARKFRLVPADSSDLESGGFAQLPGGTRAEAERRRALALKALDQRLATASPAPSPRIPPDHHTSTPPRTLGVAEGSSTSGDQPAQINGDTDASGKGKGKTRDAGL